jgi:hypothetical protein
MNDLLQEGDALVKVKPASSQRLAEVSDHRTSIVRNPREE